MVTWTMKTAWLLGVSLLVLGHLLWWVVLLEVPYGEILRAVLFFVPVVAALVVAYLAPRHKVLMGMSMSICGALIGLVAMIAYERLGYHIDKIGGLFETVAILLAFHLGYSLVGSSAGYFLCRFQTRFLRRAIPR